MGTPPGLLPVSEVPSIRFTILYTMRYGASQAFADLGRNPVEWLAKMKWSFSSSLGVTRLIALWAKGGPEHGSSPMFCYLSGVLRERKTIASRLVLFKK